MKYKVKLRKVDEVFRIEDLLNSMYKDGYVLHNIYPCSQSQIIIVFTYLEKVMY